MMLATITECEWVALDGVILRNLEHRFCVLKVEYVDYAVPATERPPA